jgi:uncharacterized Fe-S cluster protein YjdI
MSNKVTKAELKEYKKEPEKVKEYSNKDVTVFWRPELCIHSANCLMGLPGVFSTRRRPWINVEGGDTRDIMRVVDTCPSRALTFLKSPKFKTSAGKKSHKKPPKYARIQALKDGPYMVSGNFIIRDANKKKIRLDTDTVSLCSCGASKNKPFCDASHLKSILEK